MCDTVREFKISELTRILPMVHETIKKERKIRNLEDERDKKEEELEKISILLTTLESLLKVLEFSSVLNLSLTEEQIKSEIYIQSKRKGELVESLHTHEVEIYELTNQWELETKLYRSITSLIATDGGFLQVEEINIEFFQEYLYLLVIGNSFHPNFTLEKLINSEMIDTFFDFIRTNISSPYANDIADSLKFGMFDKVMFLNFFKETT